MATTPPASIRALVFDFDGLILETESVSVAAWESVYRDHGHELDRERWFANLGTVDTVDLHAELETRVGRGLDRDALRAERDRIRDEAFAVLAVMPGIVDFLIDARRLGLATAVASSSPRSWVEGHLSRLGLIDEFACLQCFDGDIPAKPAPDLYLAAVAHLGVAPSEAIAFEDSPNGIAAAKAAGLYCIAVPNSVTRALDLSQADMVVASLAEWTLPDLLAAVC